MDAFAVAVGFAHIPPDYFWNQLSLSEFEALGQAYREDWEKARLTVLALGGKFPLPWDTSGKPSYTATQRIVLGNKLTEILNKKLNG